MFDEEVDFTKNSEDVKEVYTDIKKVKQEIKVEQEINFTDSKNNEFPHTYINVNDIDDDLIKQMYEKLSSLPKNKRDEYSESIIFENKTPEYETEENLDFVKMDSKWKIIRFVRNWENRNKVTELTRKKRIQLPGDDSLISIFADELAERFKKTNDIFFREDLRDNVEITQSGFELLKPNRFITLTEKYFLPWTKKYGKFGEFKVEKSMNQQMASIVLASPNFQDNIKSIERIFPVPMPIIYNNKLTFPITGYDKRFKSWLNYDNKKITIDIPINEAKKILRDIYGEFCFQDNQDYTNAIAGLITPFLRGLFSDWNVRTPMFCYMANRERAGKDYCAGITGLVLEGHSLEEPPISSGEAKQSGHNDETRKKIISALIKGKKRLHFANNRGRINNAVLEGFLTSRVYSDRLLGKNDTPDFNNEMDVSMSGNMGITMTADLANRSRFIRLFLDIEDANQRKFSNPDLHGWVLENRSLILSAIYSLIQNWINNGKPNGSIQFSSFPEWANICGGIMESAGLGNPCQRDKISDLGLDNETEEMKSFFEYIYESCPDVWLSKEEIKTLIIESKEELFVWVDWNNKSDLMKFGKKLNNFKGRIFSDIRMVSDENLKSERRKYKFFKEKSTFLPKSGDLGTSGDFLTLRQYSHYRGIIESREKAPNPPKVPTSKILNYLKEFKETMLTKQDIDKHCVFDLEEIEQLKKEGLIYEPKPGLYQYLG